MLQVPTNSGAVEDAWQHQHDVVGPVFLINSHLVFLDNQHMQMAGTVHRVVQVKESVFVTASCWGERRTFYIFMTLESRGIRRERVNIATTILHPLKYDFAASSIERQS